MEKLEKEIYSLKRELQEKEKLYYYLKMEDLKNKYFLDYSDFLEKNEMELIFQLIFSYYLCKEYQYPIADNFIIKSAELLNLSPSEILKNFKEIIDIYAEYEKLLSEEELAEKLSKITINASLLNEDDIDLLIETFC